MTVFQRVVKYCAIAFAVYLVIMIIGGILAGIGGLSFLSDRFGGGDETGEQKIFTLKTK